MQEPFSFRPPYINYKKTLAAVQGYFVKTEGDFSDRSKKRNSLTRTDHPADNIGPHVC